MLTAWFPLLMGAAISSAALSGAQLDYATVELYHQYASMTAAGASGTSLVYRHLTQPQCGFPSVPGGLQQIGGCGIFFASPDLDTASHSNVTFNFTQQGDWFHGQFLVNIDPIMVQPGISQTSGALSLLAPISVSQCSNPSGVFGCFTQTFIGTLDPFVLNGTVTVLFGPNVGGAGPAKFDVLNITFTNASEPNMTLLTLAALGSMLALAQKAKGAPLKRLLW